MIIGRGPEYKIATKVEDNPGDLITEIALYGAMSTHLDSFPPTRRYLYDGFSIAHDRYTQEPVEKLCPHCL